MALWLRMQFLEGSKSYPFALYRKYLWLINTSSYHTPNQEISITYTPRAEARGCVNHIETDTECYIRDYGLNIKGSSTNQPAPSLLYCGCLNHTHQHGSCTLGLHPVFRKQWWSRNSICLTLGSCRNFFAELDYLHNCLSNCWLGISISPPI